MSIALSTRLFHPLTGSELRQTIVNEFERALENSPLLQQHLTFDTATYEVRFHLESYPMDGALDIRVGRQIGTTPDPKGEPQTDDVIISRELGKTQETAPDKIREDNDLPVPTMARDEQTGQMIDVPKERKITVGGGTKPRGRPRKIEVSEEPILDDSGVPIKSNKAA